MSKLWYMVSHIMKCYLAGKGNKPQLHTIQMNLAIRYEVKKKSKAEASSVV